MWCPWKTVLLDEGDYVVSLGDCYIRWGWLCGVVSLGNWYIGKGDCVVSLGYCSIRWVGLYAATGTVLWDEGDNVVPLENCSIRWRGLYGVPVRLLYKMKGNYMLSLGDWSLGEGDWLCAQLRSRLYSSCCRGLFSFTT